MPIDDKGANEAIAIEDPAAFSFPALFRSLLEKRGITVYGREAYAPHRNWRVFSTFSVTATAEARRRRRRISRPAPGLPGKLVLASSSPGR